MIANKQTLLLGAGALLAAAGVLWFVSRNAREAGRQVVSAAENLAAGAVVGVGEIVGLPDPSDAQTAAEGRAALDRGDYFEASQRLPALEFLNGIGSRFGLWVYERTHPEERDEGAGDGETFNYAERYDGGINSRLRR